MTFPLRSFLKSPLIPALALGLLAGCYTKPTDELATAVSGGEKPISMEGEGSFFGSVTVRVTIGRGIGRGTKDAKAKKNGDVRLDTSSLDSDEMSDYIRSKVAIGSPLTPLTLHLYLHNQGPAPVSIDVLDFTSDLGDFAVRPGSLAIGPGETVEPYPMVSQLGITSDALAVKVTLKLAGKKESKILTVHSLPVPDAKP